MGMFDYLIIICPECGNEIEDQTKVGDCLLRRIYLNNAPLRIQMHYEGETWDCDKCGHLIEFKKTGTPKFKLQ